MRIILNKNINIGKVVFFVEGEKTEKDIIINIFNKVLGYNVISYNKNDKNILLSLFYQTPVSLHITI